jgi:hypothetical protein
VEAVDLAAVDDQAVAGQLGRECPLLWVEADFGLLVVQPSLICGSEANQRCASSLFNASPVTDTQRSSGSRRDSRSR